MFGIVARFEKKKNKKQTGISFSREGKSESDHGCVQSIYFFKYRKSVYKKRSSFAKTEIKTNQIVYLWHDGMMRKGE